MLLATGWSLRAGKRHQAVLRENLRVTYKNTVNFS